MYISSREKLILSTLLYQTTDVTVKELAEAIDVSTRTVHRELNHIENIAKTYGMSLIRKSGVGIRLVGNDAQKKQLEAAFAKKRLLDYTKEERQALLLTILLEVSEPVKLFALASELNVTVATISNDLTQLESFLQPFHLTVLRKRGSGVEIKGSERAKRQALSHLVADYVNETTLMNAMKKQNDETNADSISNRLLQLVEYDRLTAVEQAVKEAIHALPYEMSDGSYVGLVVHLTLAIERIKKGETIRMDRTYLAKLAKTPEYRVARMIAGHLSEHYDLPIPLDEVGYITMHLQGAKIRGDQHPLLDESDLQVAVYARKLTEYVSEQLGVSLVGEMSLMKGLVAHLKPALYRIEQKMGIANPLLEKIEADYADLFAVVKRGVAHIFPQWEIPDEEVAYLVMHYGAVLLRAKQAQKVKAYVVCSSGIGTSKMLATRLRQDIPEIGDVHNVSMFDLQNIHTREEDVIISTIHIPDATFSYHMLGPIPSAEDIQQTRRHIQRHLLVHAEKQPHVKRPSEGTNPIHLFEEVHLYSGMVARLLKQIRVVHAEATHSVETILRHQCTLLAQSLRIDDVQAVLNALFAREQLGGLGIPGTELALYHARDAHVREPLFTVIHLDEGKTIQGMDREPMTVRSILLLLSPSDASSHMLELLSLISASIIESDESIRLFATGSKQDILRYLSGKFFQFLESKR